MAFRVGRPAGVVVALLVVVISCGCVAMPDKLTADVGGTIFRAGRLENGKFALVVSKDTGAWPEPIEVQVWDEADVAGPERKTELAADEVQEVLPVTDNIVAYTKFVGGKRTMTVARLDAGEELFACPFDLPFCGAMAASAGGEYLAWVEYGSRQGSSFAFDGEAEAPEAAVSIRVVHLPSRQEVVHISDAEISGSPPVTSIALSPDRKSLAIASNRSYLPSFGVVDLAEGKAVWNRSWECAGQIWFSPDGNRLVVAPMRELRESSSEIFLLETDASTGATIWSCSQKEHKVAWDSVAKVLIVGVIVGAILYAIIRSDDHEEKANKDEAVEEKEEENEEEGEKTPGFFDLIFGTGDEESDSAAADEAATSEVVRETLPSDLCAGGRFLAFASDGYVFVYDLAARRQVARIHVSSSGPDLVFVSCNARGVWATSEDRRRMQYYKFAR